MVFALLIVAAVAAMACGSSEPSAPEPAAPASAATATPTAAPATRPTQVPAATAPAATAAPTAAPATQPPPTPVSKAPSGTLRIAHSQLGFPNWELYVQTFPMNEKAIAFGTYDTLLEDDFENNQINLTRSIASAWEITDKGIRFTLNTPEKIPWHDRKYGHLTIDDIRFSWERASAEGTRWTRADILRSNFDLKNIQVADDHTMFVPWKVRDLKWDTMLSSPGPVITSKKMADDVGLEAMNLRAMGTGPMRVVSERAEDYVYTEAVPDHWRETAKVARTEWLQIPEEATRLAMLKTGEADIIEIGIDKVPTVMQTRGAWAKTEPALNRATVAIHFGGLYYQVVDHDGKATNRKPFTQLPWVGDPSDPQDMEKARKLRHALSYAIDREAIVQKYLGGNGDPNYGHYVTGPGHRLWTDELNKKYGFSYDTKMAKKLMAEAGYPDGFTYRFVNPSGRPELQQQICEAMTNMWASLGVVAKTEKIEYTAWRPKLLTREVDGAWCWGSTFDYNPADTLFRFHTRSVWNGGQEYKEALDMELKIFGAPDHATSWDVVMNEWIPWFYHELPIVASVSYPSGWGMGPKTQDWDTFRGRGISVFPLFTWRIDLK